MKIFADDILSSRKVIEYSLSCRKWCTFGDLSNDAMCTGISTVTDVQIYWRDRQSRVHYVSMDMHTLCYNALRPSAISNKSLQAMSVLKDREYSIASKSIVFN